MTRREIEAKLGTLGDYVKIDFLTQCLKRGLDFDSKKFVQLKLSALYEEKKMYAEAAKLMSATAEINTTYSGKIGDYMKSVELFVKAGKFTESDESFLKALSCGNEMQKKDMKIKKKEFYVKQAKEELDRDKRKHAMLVYEKMITLDLMPQEKQEAQDKLLNLYHQLGKIKEYYNLKKQIGV